MIQPRRACRENRPVCGVHGLRTRTEETTILPKLPQRRPPGGRTTLLLEQRAQLLLYPNGAELPCLRAWPLQPSESLCECCAKGSAVKHAALAASAVDGTRGVKMLVDGFS